MLHLCSKYIRNCLNSKGHCLSVEGEFQSVCKAFKLELQTDALLPKEWKCVFPCTVMTMLNPSASPLPTRPSPQPVTLPTPDAASISRVAAIAPPPAYTVCSCASETCRVPWVPAQHHGASFPAGSEKAAAQREEMKGLSFRSAPPVLFPLWGINVLFMNYI